MITLDPADLIRSAVVTASGLGGFGAGFAFFRPYAAQWIQHRIDRAVALAKIEDEARRMQMKAEDEQRRAIAGFAAQHERVVGVLEAMDERAAREEQERQRISLRLQRIEDHLKMSSTASATPPEPTPPRAVRALTDPSLPRFDDAPSAEPSRPAIPPRG